eukprot:5430226-Pleurochrysis_carterae.AAC.8
MGWATACLCAHPPHTPHTLVSTLARYSHSQLSIPTCAVFRASATSLLKQLAYDNCNPSFMLCQDKLKVRYETTALGEIVSALEIKIEN